MARHDPERPRRARHVLDLDPAIALPASQAGRRIASSGSPASREASAAFAEIRAAKGWVASINAAIRSSARKRASPAAPETADPHRHGRGHRVRVRPASERVVS